MVCLLMNHLVSLKGVTAVWNFCESNIMKCSIWFLIRDYKRTWFYTKFCYRNKNEGHMCYASAVISETVQDSAIVTIDN